MAFLQLGLFIQAFVFGVRAQPTRQIPLVLSDVEVGILLAMGET